jgi:AraC family transcriptional regulator of adaptative response/methylated-DNA-[protein]-cysteine methyltransferase
MLDEALCYERMAARDRTADGLFVAAVTSTGVFCRPGCPARTPLRRNVRFYATAGEAMREGFRACRRCRPLAAVPDIGLATVEALCRMIEADPAEAIDLATLAARAGYSPWHLQRRFTAIVGVSPRDYHAALRSRLYRRELRSGPSATAALHAAGYGSTSRVGGAANPLGGVTPSAYARGGAGVELSYLTIPTRFGPMLVGASDKGVAFLAFGPEEQTLPELAADFPHASLMRAEPDGASVAAWAEAIGAYLDGHRPDPRLPLDIQGTAFQQLVWSFLRSIPAGETRTYTEVAAAVGRPAAVRAAASACGANHVSLLIPCHRVIRGDGGLGGYRWGLDVKRALLAAEGARVGLV